MTNHATRPRDLPPETRRVAGDEEAAGRPTDGPLVSSSDAERRRTILTWFSAITMPPLAVYAVDDLVAQRFVEGLVEVAMFAVVLVAFLAARKGASPVVPARCAVGLGLVVLSCELVIGGGQGFAMLWFFVFPLMAFFLLGAREGAAWVVLSIAVLAFFTLVWPESRRFYELSGHRLVVTYSLVSILAWNLEANRHRYDLELRREKLELEQALAEIRKLEEMLPICAWCKKIRDDDGYWSELEAYFGRHGDFRFSHGICPECAAKVRAEA